MTTSTFQAQAVIHSAAGNEKWFLMVADAERCKAKIRSQKGDKNKNHNFFKMKTLKDYQQSSSQKGKKKRE